jgi:hypothetical protein
MCQLNTHEPLSSHNVQSTHSCYKGFLENVTKFRELDELPINLKCGAEEENVEIFVRNRASWHKTCYVKFSNTKLERAVARKRKETESNKNNESTRVKRKKAIKSVCILCGKEGEVLHEVATFEVDQKVRMMATELEDLELLAK